MYHMGIAEGQAEGADYLIVAKFLHRLARRYGCALMLEQHAPMAQGGKPRVLRPIGSVLWTKWPDFGWGLRPVKTKGDDIEQRFRVDRFRGPREVRPWPSELYWRNPPGALVTGWGWPWAATYPPGTLTAPPGYTTPDSSDEDEQGGRRLRSLPGGASLWPAAGGALTCRVRAGPGRETW